VSSSPTRCLVVKLRQKSTLACHVSMSCFDTGSKEVGINGSPICCMAVELRQKSTLACHVSMSCCDTDMMLCLGMASSCAAAIEVRDTMTIIIMMPNIRLLPIFVMKAMFPIRCFSFLFNSTYSRTGLKCIIRAQTAAGTLEHFQPISK